MSMGGPIYHVRDPRGPDCAPEEDTFMDGYMCPACEKWAEGAWRAELVKQALPPVQGRKGPPWAWRLQDRLQGQVGALIVPVLLVGVLGGVWLAVRSQWPELQWQLYTTFGPAEPAVLATLSVGLVAVGFLLGRL